MASLIKTENLTPDEAYRAKLLQIFELALLLNPTETKKWITGNKPTVFFRYTGQTPIVNLQVFPEGWECQPNDHATDFWISNNCDNGVADECIKYLESLLDEGGQ